MKLQFDPNQDYQKQAINAIADLFEGQPLSSGDLDFAITEGSLQFSENGVGNRIALTEEQVLPSVKE